MSGDADTCPHCGADHGGTSATTKSASFAGGMRLPFGVRREALSTPSPYPSVPEEAELAGTGEQRWDMSKTVTLGAVALALVAGGVIYSQHSDNDATHSATPAGQSAYGAIDMKTAHNTPAPAPLPAAVPTGKSATAVKQAQTPAAPSVAAREALPAESSSRGATAALASATDNLQAARDAIQRGDLSTARKRFSKIPASQLTAGNVQRTQAELTGLERQRDEMLQTARGCEATGSWLCVRQNARDVLTIDASNAEAQTLVEHAIARSGWLNNTSPATTTAHAAPRSNGPAAAAPAAPPTPVFVPGPRYAATPPAPVHRHTVTVSAAEHARALAAMGVPTPIPTPAPAAPSAPVARTIVPTPVAAPIPAPVTAPAVSEQARIGANSQAPLTSPAPPYTPPSTQQQAAPARPPAPAFIPMPDGPDPAAVRSAPSPANAAARAPAQPDPEPEPAAAARIPADIPSPPVIHSLAPITEAVPVRAAIVSPPVAASSAPAVARSSTRPPSPTATRAPASGDNAASGTQQHAPGFNATNPDDQERAILQSGWTKNQPSQQRPPLQQE
ncbi:hypothetical protein M0D69_27210 [Caballeronia sp. SEWSISQ10-4 2]|uniref:hypothetical protein n=1 Tax=Caballeronia sp. SEWSISQ10-4 2 TaxID=2937438 RepID=UPI00264B22BC|nr:hypothetical protein [Caballeronia sp. SEWSISQ10-4 2]MDN7181628.1 hypothetical protein [Caballeronia sp. SEWSISQ10-4 2]